MGHEFVKFPRSAGGAVHGTIDIWYVMHDGGILVMIAWLLQHHADIATLVFGSLDTGSIWSRSAA